MWSKFWNNLECNVFYNRLNSTSQSIQSLELMIEAYQREYNINDGELAEFFKLLLIVNYQYEHVIPSNDAATENNYENLLYNKLESIKNTDFMSQLASTRLDKSEFVTYYLIYLKEFFALCVSWNFKYCVRLLNNSNVIVDETYTLEKRLIDLMVTVSDILMQPVIVTTLKVYQETVCKDVLKSLLIFYMHHSGQKLSDESELISDTHKDIIMYYIERLKKKYSNEFELWYNEQTKDDIEWITPFLLEMSNQMDDAIYKNIDEQIKTQELLNDNEYNNIFKQFISTLESFTN